MDKLNLAFGIVKTIKNWPTYFLDYYGFLPGNGAVTYVLPEGAKISCRRKTGDRSAINEIWIRKLYLPNADFEVKEDDVVVDVGGHIGVFSVYAAKKAKKGRIYSYEPHNENFRMLEGNIGLNNLQNVKCFNLGVSGKEGKSKLNIAPLHTGGHSIIMVQSDKYMEINCTTLEAIFEKNSLKKVNFLKMDCEGAEYGIFSNTPREIFGRIEKIAMETHDNVGGHYHSEIKKLLESYDFNVFVKGNMLFAIRKS